MSRALPPPPWNGERTSRPWHCSPVRATPPQGRVATTPERPCRKHSRKGCFHFPAATMFFAAVMAAADRHAAVAVMTAFFPGIASGAMSGGHAAAGGLQAAIHSGVLQSSCLISARLMPRSMEFPWAAMREALPGRSLDTGPRKAAPRPAPCPRRRSGSPALGSLRVPSAGRGTTPRQDTGSKFAGIRRAGTLSRGRSAGRQARCAPDPR